MAVSTKNIVAYPKMCAEMNCDSCSSENCLLCNKCMDTFTRAQFTNAYREYISRHDCKRVFPPTFVSICSHIKVTKTVILINYLQQNNTNNILSSHLIKLI